MKLQEQLIEKAIAHANEVLSEQVFETEDQAEMCFNGIVDDYMEGAMEVYDNYMSYGLIKASIN